MREQDNIESLIVKYLNDTIQDDEYRELIAWIGQSMDNELMFNQMREILLVSMLNDENFQFDSQVAFERVVKEARVRQMQKSIPELKNLKPRKGIKLSYHWAAAVALLLLMCGSLFNYLLLRPSYIPAVFQEVIVPLGSRSKVLLPDGSHVNLNAGSTLRYHTDFGVKCRDLWLDGEGFFEVCKSSTPFVVHSGTVQIKAVGTSFNVRAYSSEKVVETTLVSGKIVVTNTDSHDNAVEERTLLPNQKLIIPCSPELAEQTVFDNNTNPDTPNSPVPVASRIIFQEKVDPEPDISWKDNKWIINREDLVSLAVKLERRFDIEIVFMDEQLKSFRYNGSLPDLSLEQVLNVMSMVSPINYSVNGKTVVFSKNKNYKTQ